MSATTQQSQGHNDISATTANDTSVTVTRDTDQHEMTTLDGDQVRYDLREDRETHVSGEWPAAADAHVRQLIDQATAEREKRENVRANHRNFNRMLTLIGALVIGLVVTYMLQHKGLPALGLALPSWTYGLAPYSFVITVALDAGLALYGLIRHY